MKHLIKTKHKKHKKKKLTFLTLLNVWIVERIQDSMQVVLGKELLIENNSPITEKRKGRTLKFFILPSFEYMTSPS